MSDTNVPTSDPARSPARDFYTARLTPLEDAYQSAALRLFAVCAVMVVGLVVQFVALAQGQRTLVTIAVVATIIAAAASHRIERRALELREDIATLRNAWQQENDAATEAAR